MLQFELPPVLSTTNPSHVLCGCSIFAMFQFSLTKMPWRHNIVCHVESKRQRSPFPPLWRMYFSAPSVCLPVFITSKPQEHTHVHTGERLHIKLFVAGLAPWEPNLHLSLLHSWASVIPQILHQWWPFFLLHCSISDPIILLFLALFSCAEILAVDAPSHALRKPQCDSHTNTSLSVLILK